MISSQSLISFIVNCLISVVLLMVYVDNIDKFRSLPVLLAKQCDCQQTGHTGYLLHVAVNFVLLGQCARVCGRWHHSANASPLTIEGVQRLGLFHEPYMRIVAQCAHLGKTSKYKDNSVSFVRKLGVTMRVNAKCVGAAIGL